MTYEPIADDMILDLQHRMAIESVLQDIGSLKLTSPERIKLGAQLWSEYKGTVYQATVARDARWRGLLLLSEKYPDKWNEVITTLHQERE